MNTGSDIRQTRSKKESKGKLLKFIPLIAYFAVWIIGVIAFWCFSGESDGIGFSLLYFWIALPLATVIASFFISLFDHWGKFKWLCSVGFGVTYMLGEYATFSLANSITFHKINPPAFSMVFIGMIVSLVGMGMGHIFCKSKKD